MKRKRNNGTSGEIGIGDVSKICGIPDYTIRYWEREFKEEFSPSRTQGKQRRYGDEDIDRLLQIKKLLWIENYSIKGAKRVLKGNLMLHDMSTEKDFTDKDTHELAMQIARLINQQLTQIKSAA
jgi:DNA-binding transcriptional MerR regulator